MVRSAIASVQVEGFLQAMRRDFYNRKLSGPENTPPSDELVTDNLFATMPAHGAAIITMDALAAEPQ